MCRGFAQAADLIIHSILVSKLALAHISQSEQLIALLIASETAVN